MRGHESRKIFISTDDPDRSNAERVTGWTLDNTIDFVLVAKRTHFTGPGSTGARQLSELIGQQLRGVEGIACRRERARLAVSVAMGGGQQVAGDLREIDVCSVGVWESHGSTRRYHRVA